MTNAAGSTAHEARFVVGIDLGTTNTVVACAALDGGVVSDVELTQVTAPNETMAQAQLPSVLYRAGAELAPQAAQLPWDTGSVDVIGAFAKAQAARVPGRVVTSAKSWLSVAGVDRHAAILPWGSTEPVAKVSPVDVQAQVLRHVRHAWDHRHKDAPLDAQDVVVTIPASFDESARELTLLACERAGLAHARLLEEPLAAFYATLKREEHRLVEAFRDVRVVLVIDVGGGTTDLTLVRVDAAADGKSPPTLTRIAVGDHLMLGGDNMDITLARHAEMALAGAVGALDAISFAGLTHSARVAKETLLAGAQAPDATTLTVAARSSKLVGGSKSTRVSKTDVERLLVDGFFPLVTQAPPPMVRRSGLTELGLPYEREPAITRHVADFLRRHAHSAADSGARIHHDVLVPDAVLLNGGVFRSPVLRERTLHVLTSLCGQQVKLWGDSDDKTALDHAVARGAAFSGLVRRGRGLRIGGGSARAYFVGVGASSEAGAHERGQERAQERAQDRAQERALCVVPKGMREGERVSIDRTFKLLLDRPSSFALYSSTTSNAQAGELIPVNAPEAQLEALPPLQAVITSEATVPVRVESFLSEVGTLDLQLRVTDAALRSFRLAFSTRIDAGTAAGAPAGAVPRAEGLHQRIEDARALVLAYFGSKGAALDVTGKKDFDKSKVKDLRRELEKLLGPRDDWSPGSNREIGGALLSGLKNRRRSLEHERAFFQLVGFALRPGTGAPFDDWRIEQLWPLWAEGVQHVGEKPTWASWFILWRRVAGGLSAERQLAVWSYLKPWLLEQGTGSKGQGPTPHGQDEMVQLACALERVPARDKAELGAFVLKKIGRGGVSSWAPLGRVGARLPLFGSAHDVVPPDVVAPWIDRMLNADLAQAEGGVLALAHMARRVNDRALDIDEALRAKVVDKLKRLQAPPEVTQLVTEHVLRSFSDDVRSFGESLPAGLQL